MCIRDRVWTLQKEETVTLTEEEAKKQGEEKLKELEEASMEAVSYTHLDVYKRQVKDRADNDPADLGRTVGR